MGDTENAAAKRWAATPRMDRAKLIRDVGGLEKASASVVAIYSKLDWEDLSPRMRLSFRAHWNAGVTS